MRRLADVVTRQVLAASMVRGLSSLTKYSYTVDQSLKRPTQRVQWRCQSVAAFYHLVTVLKMRFLVEKIT